MFCQYYVKNNEYRSNARRCYALAYHYDLDNLPDDDAVTETIDDGEGGTYERVIEPSTRKKAERVCEVNGCKLLSYTKVQDRIRELLNEMLADDVVDAELAKVILQDHELPAKNKAIQIYNDIKGRVIKKADITSGGEPINNITDDDITKLIAARQGRAKQTNSKKAK